MSSLPTPAEIDAVLGVLAARRGVDFRDYRREVLERGLSARLLATSSRNAADYANLLDREPTEVERLLETLVIPVSAFFRDRTVFDALERRVLPELCARARGGTLRAWAVGIATGEEAWSLAMSTAEACEAAGLTSFELLASDIDTRSLDVARRGLYEAASLAKVPPALRARFFEPVGGEAERVSDALRARVRFALHNVMGRALAPREAVLASFHLVSFRNVLIYFERRLQQKALERLASVLEPGGALVLGAVESLPPRLSARFEPYPGVDPSLRIYRLADQS